MTALNTGTLGAANKPIMLSVVLLNVVAPFQMAAFNTN
jgi:hypothetical protein